MGEPHAAEHGTPPASDAFRSSIGTRRPIDRAVSRFSPRATVREPSGRCSGFKGSPSPSIAACGRLLLPPPCCSALPWHVPSGTAAVFTCCLLRALMPSIMRTRWHLDGRCTHGSMVCLIDCCTLKCKGSNCLSVCSNFILYPGRWPRQPRVPFPRITPPAPPHTHNQGRLSSVCSATPHVTLSVIRHTRNPSKSACYEGFSTSSGRGAHTTPPPARHRRTTSALVGARTRPAP